MKLGQLLEVLLEIVRLGLLRLVRVVQLRVRETLKLDELLLSPLDLHSFQKLPGLIPLPHRLDLGRLLVQRLRRHLIQLRTLGRLDLQLVVLLLASLAIRTVIPHLNIN